MQQHALLQERMCFTCCALHKTHNDYDDDGNITNFYMQRANHINSNNKDAKKVPMHLQMHLQMRLHIIKLQKMIIIIKGTQ